MGRVSPALAEGLMEVRGEKDGLRSEKRKRGMSGVEGYLHEERSRGDGYS